jgi:hypothetical protein
MVATSPGAIYRAVGCTTGLVGKIIIKFAVAAGNDGQYEAEDCALVLGCAIGATGGFIDIFKEGWGNPIENTYRLFDVYTSLGGNG